jgi:hypothetical protein
MVVTHTHRVRGCTISSDYHFVILQISIWSWFQTVQTRVWICTCIWSLVPYYEIEMNQLPIFRSNIVTDAYAVWLGQSPLSNTRVSFRRNISSSLYKGPRSHLLIEYSGGTECLQREIVGPHMEQRQQSFPALVAGKNASAISVILTPLTSNMCMHPSFNLVSWCKWFTLKKRGLEVGISTEMEEAKCKEREIKYSVKQDSHKLVVMFQHGRQILLPLISRKQ